MSALTGIYAIWYREMKVFMRERSRIIASLVNPILWLLIIGGGLGSSVAISGVNYQTFIFPGVLVQAVLFSSVFYGVYIVWDKKIDFLKEVIVSPLSRSAMFIGKVVGGATDTMLQVTILLVVGFIFTQTGIMSGLILTPSSLLLAFAFLAVTTVSLVSLGLILGSQMESPEGFQLVSSFVIFPMFFLSGALFPINQLPPWLAPFVLLDPVTYAVDGLRAALIGTSAFPMAFDFAVLCTFATSAILVGTYAFKRMRF